MRSAIPILFRQTTALLVLCVLPFAAATAGAPSTWQQPPAASDTITIIPDGQLDSLVAPIALYPDPLLAQMLVASTYPLEIIQLQQWLDRNQSLQGQALTEAVQKQDWDPSIQALAVLPDVVKILSENIQWTTGLGNAFLAQENDVMNAVQRMRAKAQGTGKLQSSPQQTVQTQVIEDKQVIVIQQADPQTVYVPTYDPVVMFGDPYYPYPPMYYPPGYYVPGRGLAFGAGLAIGYAWGQNNWGWNCGWGGNNTININNNNNFIDHNNLKAGNRPSQQPGQGGQKTWQHDPGHRAGAPYGDRQTASKYGGNARGDSIADRQQTARQNPGNFGGGNRDLGGSRPGAGQGNLGGDRQAGGLRDVSASPNRNAGNFGGGNRDISRGSGNGAFGGASSGMNRSSARASQSRGSASMGRTGGAGRAGGGRRR